MCLPPQPEDTKALLPLDFQIWDTKLALDMQMFIFRRDKASQAQKMGLTCSVNLDFYLK